MNKRAEPKPMPGCNADFSVTRSVRIRDTLIGTIKSRWVYSSACRAKAKVLSRGCHPTATEIANRSANCRNGDILAIARLGSRDKEIVTPRLRNIRAMIGLPSRTNAIGVGREEIFSCDPDHRARCARKADKYVFHICMHRRSCPNREGWHPADTAKSYCLGK